MGGRDIQNGELTEHTGYSLPESIQRLRELRQMDFRGNPLTHLPTTIVALPHLEKLDLRWVSTLVTPEWIVTLEQRGCLVYR
jgi:hypothetical protein